MARETIGMVSDVLCSAIQSAGGHEAVAEHSERIYQGVYRSEPVTASESSLELE